MQVGAISLNAPSALRTGQTGAGGGDSQVESLKKRINELQDQLKSLGGNQEIPAGEKQEKQKQIREEIADLQRQMTERQAAIQKEKREARAAERVGAQETSQEPADRKNPAVTITFSDMKTLIAADEDMQRAQAGDSIKASMQRRLKVASVEADADAAGPGGVTPSKAGEISSLASKVDSLNEGLAGQVAQLSANTVQKTDKAGSKEEKNQDSPEAKAEEAERKKQLDAWA